MAMCLEATDPEYLNRIYDGPHRTITLAVVVACQEENMVDKDKKDYSSEDLFIYYKKCTSTTAIKKNRRTILTQEYEHFDSKVNESLTKIYDRFQKLMNDLSLVDKEYDPEDSNLKFLLALPEKWDLKVISIMDNYDLDDTSLDEIYVMLKTHELEMEQRSKRKGPKPRQVAIKVEGEPREKDRRKSHSKGKVMIVNSDTELSNSNDDTDSESESDIEGDHDNNEDIEQMDALLRRNSNEKELKSGKYDKSKEKCYNCDGVGHFAADCRKPRAEKKQALNTKKKNLDDTSESDDGVNYALMENADIEADTTELKIEGGLSENEQDTGLQPPLKKKRYHRHTAHQIQEMEAYELSTGMPAPG
ncbi:hypothetical protein AgCh_022041 [Apium graveolens]